MLSPGQFLEATIQAKARKNPRLSKRGIARMVGVSAPYLSRVLSGKSKLSLSRATAIADTLKMKSTEKALFLKSVAVHGANEEAQRILVNAVDENPPVESTFASYTPVDGEMGASLFAEWYLPALLDLVTCVDFRPELPWISQRLGVSEESVESGLRTLEKLGLLSRQGGNWRKVEHALYCLNQEPKAFVRAYHAKIARRIADNLDREPSAEEYDRRSLTAMTLAIDPAHLGRAKRMIARFQNRLADLLTFGTCTEVYHLGVQLVPLTQPAPSEDPS